MRKILLPKGLNLSLKDDRDLKIIFDVRSLTANVAIVVLSDVDN
ncbi:hypothetical protein [Calothrix sp. NIES-2100]